jgi:hypothetical protein
MNLNQRRTQLEKNKKSWEIGDSALTVLFLYDRIELQISKELGCNSLASP